jgi:flagellar assembly protein FliH
MLSGQPRKASLDEFSSAGRKVQLQKTAAQAGDATGLEQVREQAYRQGVAVGRQEAAAQIEAERAALKRLTESFQELLQELEQGLANDVLSMSLELAKLIVRHAIRVQPDLVLSVVREAVASLTGFDAQTTIHLHPADGKLVRDIASDDPLLAGLPWKIVDDINIERGGCRLETATTEVDATLETRWRRVIAALGREDSWIDITT